MTEKTSGVNSSVEARRPRRNEILMIVGDSAGRAILSPSQHTSTQTTVLLEVGDRVDLNRVPEDVARKCGLGRLQRGIVGAAGYIEFTGLPDNPKISLNDLINQDFPVTLTVSHLSNFAK